MTELQNNSDLLSFVPQGNPPDWYRVTLACRGLVWNDQIATPSLCRHFEVEIELHAEYPRKRPGLKMMSPIFHPNFFNGGICTGTWTPATSLDNLCLQIGRMIQYKNYQLSDFLNDQARIWASANEHLFPIGNRDFIRNAHDLIG
jgi:ubiquitin-protein ligase